MSYLNEFHKKLDHKDFMGLLTLWEEYCTCDEVDGIELNKILGIIFDSEFSEGFGQYAESILPLWEALEPGDIRDSVFEKIIDLQTTNSSQLAELSYAFLTEHFSNHPLFLEKIRLVGLRTNENFRRAIRNYKLLTHIEKGNFVFHTAGWGTGEILETSLIREEVLLEFENVLGVKKLSFENIFKTLEPLPSDHFLALRFGDADALELTAKKKPIEIIQLLLKDLGPKTASEIKDELLDLVIPKKEWSNWWQSTRNKLKKETSIVSPSSLHKPFQLCHKDVSHFQRFENELELINKTNRIDDKTKIDRTIVLVYNFMRDFSEELRKNDVLLSLKELISTLLVHADLTDAQRFCLQVFSEETHGKEYCATDLKLFIENLELLQPLLSAIEIASVKKKVLILIRKQRSDWTDVFKSLFLTIDQTLLREYILKELGAFAREQLEDMLHMCLKNPSTYADVLFWYFQKSCQDSSLPLTDAKGRTRLLEAYFLALIAAERDRTKTALVKKMVQFLTNKKFAVTRKVLQGLSKEFLKELMLLVAKSHSFSSHETQIFNSLIIVACPDLNSAQEKPQSDEEEMFWTSQNGLNKLKQRLEHLTSVEMVDVAKEIEEARAHGDLRENSEYKYALERRSRIQNEIAELGEKVRCARLLTSADVDLSSVNIGTQIQLDTENATASKLLTIMGPWEADIEKNILSAKSKMAKSLLSKSVGDKVDLEGQKYKITKIELASVLS